MSDSEYFSEEDEKNEENISYKKKNKFILICVDVCHKTRALDFLNFLSEVLETLYKSPHKVPKFGILFVGGKSESIKIVLDPSKDFRTEYEQFIAEAKNIQEGSFTLPLKETLTFAVQLIIQNESTDNDKQIVLITDTVNPKLPDGDKMQTWDCIRDMEQANIKFVLVPLTKVDLTTSDVYEELASLVEKFEVNDSNRSILEILRRLHRKPEIHFYYHEHNYIIFNSNKLFSIPSRNEKSKKKKPVVNIKETEMIDTFSDSEYLAKDEIQDFKIFAIPTTRKQGNLELLYVTSNLPPLPLPRESQGVFITPKKYDPASVELASHFWNYCTSNNKILICLYNTKRVRKAYLRPSMFKGEFGFILQAMGYLDDYNLIDSKEFISTQLEPSYKKTMYNIIMALKENKSTISISDPKLKHYNAMKQAKKDGKSLENSTFEDETSKNYHNVKSKIAKFVDEFISLSMHDVEYTEPVKKRSGKPLSKYEKKSKK